MTFGDKLRGMNDPDLAEAIAALVSGFVRGASNGKVDLKIQELTPQFYDILIQDWEENNNE